MRDKDTFAVKQSGLMIFIVLKVNMQPIIHY